MPLVAVNLCIGEQMVEQKLAKKDSIKDDESSEKTVIEDDEDTVIDDEKSVIEDDEDTENGASDDVDNDNSEVTSEGTNSNAGKVAVKDANQLSDADFDDSDEDDASVSKSNESSVDDEKLPFPRATITNLVRKNVSKGKQIKGNVKDEMNSWVNKMVERIAKKMNSQPYTFVNYDMLKDAIAPYDDLQSINKQRGELIKKIDLIKNECDSVISAIDAEAKSRAVSLKLDSADLPFPKATITNKLRKHLDEKKTIKGPVKRGLNVWLGGLVARVSKKMDSYPYPYIDRSMFKESIEPYEAVGEIELEKERIIQQMESMRTICDLLVLEINRKFKL